MPLRRLRTRDAFTLIELLVVISIIALLLAVLLPALSKAKEHAMAVVCSTRIKNVGQATMLYQTDYKNYIPPYVEDVSKLNPPLATAGFNNYWMGKMTKYLTNRDYSMKPREWVSSGEIETTLCPSAWPFSLKKLQKGSSWAMNADIWRHCFGIRAWIKPGTARPIAANYLEFRRLSDIKTSPADFFLFADSFSFVFEAQGPSIMPAPRTIDKIIVKEGEMQMGARDSHFVHARHFGSFDMLFADMHIDRKKPDYIQQIAESQKQYAIPNTFISVFTGKAPSAVPSYYPR
jgi:prepilin-type N-terminal cleavage/methylation domain-containing protein